MKLTVVDQSPVHGDSAANMAPLHSVELAKACDELGYFRYWLAEHHNTIQFANPCPEIMIARIASVTRNMRIGSGGVMLTHYSPYKVAEVFRMLETLFPNRIDLGIGRAPGGDPLASAALAAPHDPSVGDQFSSQAHDLVGYLQHSMQQDHPFKVLRQMPDNSPLPELWMLGSGGGSAALAGALGIGLSVARFIAPQQCNPGIFQNYLAAFEAAEHKHTPLKMLAVAAICAETEQEAKFIAGPAAYRKIMTRYGKREPLHSPEAIMDIYQRLAISVQAEFDATISVMTCGTSEQCWQDMHRLAGEYSVDEMALVTVTHDYQSRLNSYQLLAKGA